MKREELTPEQFAIWSFERDKSVGLYPKNMFWNELPKDEKEGYIQEANYYLLEDDDWPLDILERLEK